MVLGTLIYLHKSPTSRSSSIAVSTPPCTAQPEDYHDKATRSLNRDQVLEPPSRILDLPPKLVKVIFDKLDPRSLLASHRVCLAFRDLSLTTFGVNFFKHVVVMLHPMSLMILERIADHTTISKFVHHLTVSGDEIDGFIVMSD